MLSHDACTFFFDFVKSDLFPFNDKKTIEVPISKSGLCCGIIQWIRLEMDDTVVFKNHPSVKNPASGWQQTVYVFPSAIDIAEPQNKETARSVF
jgi:hypothetical protein